MKKIPIIALLLTLLSARILLGQAASGTINGTVTDNTGAVIPEVSVTVTNEGTGFTRTVITNQNGQYVAEFFPIGAIQITAQKSGFTKLERRGVQLTAADVLTVDLKLAIGSVQQSVEVTAEGTLLQTQTQAVSSLVSNQQITEMPLNQRIFTQVLQLMPGQTSTTPNPQAGGTYGGLASTAYSINGAQSVNSMYLLDGLYNKNAWIETIAISPPVDGLQEVRVMAGTYSAEFGNAAGAVTLAYSKSGTNEFHGTAYEFLQNTDLNANTFFNNAAGTPRTQTHKNQYGAPLGGRFERIRHSFSPTIKGKRFTPQAPPLRRFPRWRSETTLLLATSATSAPRYITPAAWLRRPAALKPARRSRAT